MSDELLNVTEIQTEFPLFTHTVHAVNKVSFRLNKGEILGVVGESGSGKTVMNMSLLGLVAKPGRVVGGKATFMSKTYGEVDLLSLPEAKLRNIRGNEISMIFQDAMTALNPYMRVSEQMTEMLVHHKKMKPKDALKKAIDRLREVGIPEPQKRIRQYPHEFSGGQRQRVMIAMALICDPQIVIADEPTTALDVTIQAQVLDVLRKLQASHGTSIIFISHNLGVIAQLCERVMVMYGGRAAEIGSTEEVFKQPSHQYTNDLMKSVPRLDETGHQRLKTIAGQPPNLKQFPNYCPYAARCGAVEEDCRETLPTLETLGGSHRVACFHQVERAS